MLLSVCANAVVAIVADIEQAIKAEIKHLDSAINITSHSYFDQLFRLQSFLNMIITCLSSYFQSLKYKFVYFAHKYFGYL